MDDGARVARKRAVLAKPGDELAETEDVRVEIKANRGVLHAASALRRGSSYVLAQRTSSTARSILLGDVGLVIPAVEEFDDRFGADATDGWAAETSIGVTPHR